MKKMTLIKNKDQVDLLWIWLILMADQEEELNNKRHLKD